MILSCPTCHQPLDPERHSCPQGHTFALRDGVLSLLDVPFARRLHQFNDTLAQYRAATGRRLLDPALYAELPFAAALQSQVEWRLRRYDWAVAQQWVGVQPQRVLDIGAWNGWLSHRLALMGHEVTAVDYFTDPYDGLGAKQFYPTIWQAIQLDLTDLSPLPPVFDRIILNRCLAFFSDPAAYLAQVQTKLAPGGSLLLTGLAFYRNPSSKAQAVADMTQNYRQQYGVEMFLNPTKGYLDGEDQRRLAAAGVRLTPYPQLFLANVKAWLRPKHPRYYYGRFCKA
jgi:2-polyprenyl-3-methyl-5-hydroxy-6-metoxy-1,4-benzoquinol methylase